MQCATDFTALCVGICSSIKQLLFVAVNILKLLLALRVSKLFMLEKSKTLALRLLIRFLGKALVLSY
jgi:hypothetical protein